MIPFINWHSIYKIKFPKIALKIFSKNSSGLCMMFHIIKPIIKGLFNMKLTNKGRYAVMAMADLAKINAKQPTSLTEISLRQGISISFLEQIFLKLKKNNLVQSSRGPSGGYLLTKSPEEIKLSSIIKAVDEKVKTLACKKESKKGCNGKSIKCITHNLWDELENHINYFFEKNTLKDIVYRVNIHKKRELNQ